MFNQNSNINLQDSPQFPMQLNQDFNEDTNFRNEIKNFESHLILHGFPSCVDILMNIPRELSQRLMSNLNTMVIQKQKDNEVKVELIEKIKKLENEKFANDTLFIKQNRNQIEANEKYKKLEQTYIDKRAKWKKKKQNLIQDKEQEAKLVQKLQMRENQYIHEIKKKEKLILTMQEQVKKSYSNESKNSNMLSLESPRSEISLSYPLSIRGNTTISWKNVPAKQIFQDEYQKNVDSKYAKIIEEIDKIKRFLFSFHGKFSELAQTRKEYFLKLYKNTFGYDYINDDVDMNIDKLNLTNSSINFSELNISMDVDLFTNTIEANFEKLKEFLSSSDELRLANNNTDSYDKEYIMSLVEMLENYRRVNRCLLEVIDTSIVIREMKDMNDAYNCVTRYDQIDLTKINSEDLRELCSRLKIKNLSNSNSSEEITKLKDNYETYLDKCKKEHNELEEELQGFNRILENTKHFIVSNSIVN